MTENCTHAPSAPVANDPASLAVLRKRLATRLGFAVQAAMGALPPGMEDLLDDFLRGAQEFLFRTYPLFRAERVQHFGRFLGQADDPARAARHGYSIRLRQAPARSHS